MGKSKDIFGKKFNSLLAIRKLDARKTYGQVIWEFICDCGKLTEHESARVISGKIKSCGCSRKARNPQMSGLKVFYQDYKLNAQNRNHIFKLKFKQFINLVSDSCHYCGSGPIDRKRKFNFKANGIDRVDNKKGYVLTNVVTCCTICNRAKSKMSYKDFTNWIYNLKER